jgi:hypothetical protein
MQFPHQTAVSAIRADQDLTHKLGIKSNTSCNLTILNYGGNSPKNEITNCCRGLIIDENGQIIAACMIRFFNIAEIKELVINKDVSYPVIGKVDGSYIQLYRYDGKIFLSTRGVINATTYQEYVMNALNIINQEMFQNVFSNLFDEFGIHTLWFEYTSPNNRIVTLYKKDQVWLLGGFLKTGHEIDPNTQKLIMGKLDQMLKTRFERIGQGLSSRLQMIGDKVWTKLAWPIKIIEENIRKLFEQKCDLLQPNKFMASLNDLDNIFKSDTKLIEGFVIVINGVRHKYKNPAWVEAHVSAHNLTFEKILNNVLYRRGDINELIAIIPSLADTYNPVIELVDKLNQRINYLWKLLRGKHKRERYELAGLEPDGMTLYKWIIYDSEHYNDFATNVCKDNIASMKHRIEIIDILGMRPKKDIQLIVPKEWALIGCKYSTDKDIIIFAETLQEFYADYDTKIFEEMFPDSEIDLNVALIRKINGTWRIMQTRKGIAVNTHNIVYFTARTPTRITCKVELNIHDMARVIASHVMSFMKALLPIELYASQSRNRTKALTEKRVEYAIDVLRMIKPIDNQKWHSEMKSVVMKLLQLILYHLDTTEVYQKQELAEISSAKLGLSEDGLLWYLFRGTRGSYDADVLGKLIDKYVEILQDISVERSWSTLAIDTVTNKTNIDDKLFKMFIASPSVCTQDFATRFHIVHGEAVDTITQVFATKNSKTDLIPDPLRHLAVDIIQGSKEWLEFQHRYNPHSANHKPPEEHPFGYAAQYYNLIRGSMCEAIACDAIHKDGYYNLHVGMLLDKNMELAISPDLLLVSTDRKNVIVYEIKAVYGAKDSGIYKRAVWMATRQVQRAANMIRSTGINVYGRIVLVYVSDSDMFAEETEIVL